jgi:hypothetical protein
MACKSKSELQMDATLIGVDIIQLNEKSIDILSKPKCENNLVCKKKTVYNFEISIQMHTEAEEGKEKWKLVFEGKVR